MASDRGDSSAAHHAHKEDAPARPDIGARVHLVRKKMADAGVDALLVRSTDRFLNEYVPEEDSSRIWVSGFTGSMGEVLILADRAFVAVDGRYWLQADTELAGTPYTVVKVPLGMGIDAALQAELKTLLHGRKEKKPLVLGLEPAKMSPSEVEAWSKALGPQVTLKPLFPSPVDVARGPQKKVKNASRIRALDESRVGLTVPEKLEALSRRLDALGVDALLIQRLDELAWLSNLRGDELPYQATFKAVGLATRDRLYLGLDPSRVEKEVRVARPAVLFVPEAEIWTTLTKKKVRIGYDPAHNTELLRRQIEKSGAEAVAIDSPIGPMKAKKTKAELRSMEEAFARADRVVDAAVAWLCEEIEAKQKVTESDFAERVKQLFYASGATGLSFRVISAAGKNGAIIHYSDPSPTRLIKRGELMLLDTGAYYEEGYATDLTRTFLVGGKTQKADPKQRRYYTLVLKAAIAGMRAVIPEGARGAQLDAITRQPLWNEGLDYNHGTGHGVGVNVHEFPPRIGPTSVVRLEEGHVFSIEPGVYLPEFGGVRIENLCTLVRSKARPGFLEVSPLTFSPLDGRLIDPKLLSADEKAWLASFEKRFTSPKKPARGKRSQRS
ncbi:MAG: M24 family metallopeptidase [Myxococcota bacterium]